MHPQTAEVLTDSQPVPPFFQELASRFQARQNNVFLLAGNTMDWVDALGVATPATEPAHPGRFVPLEDFLAARFRVRGRLVLTYNIARGLRFDSEQGRERLRALYAAGDAGRAQRFDRAVAESAAFVFLTLRFLEELFLLARTGREAFGATLALLIEPFDTLLPDAPLSSMSDGDRQRLTLLVEWFSDPGFRAAPDVVLLVAATTSAVHAGVRALPAVATVHVPLPDAAARRAFLEARGVPEDAVGEGLPREAIVEQTAGMTLLTMEQVLLEARHRGGAVRAEHLLAALNRLLLSLLGDRVEVIRPPHSMEDVVGATALKMELERLRALLALRDPRVAPVGILVAGPNGSGKTFVFEAWAASCGRLVIALKNLRSMYFGETDQIFERLRQVLEVLGNVIVLVDEADTVFAAPGPQVHETEARLFGHFIRMMGNPANRGRIVWVLLTARPDRLAPDLKRSGRAGLHLPVFDPEGEDRRAFLRSIVQRAGLPPESLDGAQWSDLEARTAGLSPADFNELLVELRAERLLAGGLDHAAVVRVLGNMVPGTIGRQRRAQTLQALLACSRRSLIPTSLAGITREQAEAELAGA